MKTPRSLVAHQKGTTLLVAMVALVAMMTAGMALIRSVDSANLVASNFQMQQSAEQNLDLALNEAMLAYLKSHSNSAVNIANTNFDSVTTSYRAIRNSAMQTSDGLPSELVNLTPPTWGVNGPLVSGTWPGEQVDLQSKQLRRYFIERLCNTTGIATAANCQMYTLEFEPNAQKGSGVDLDTEDLPFIRVTARIDGPKGAVSYAQLFVKGY